jgi:sulfoxide reductase heme-binding subunit YedZ
VAKKWWLYKSAVFLACLAPAAWLVWAAFTGNLSANPIDDITDATGRWCLRLLLLTLAISPLRQLTGWSSLMRFRRMLGLFAFFYAFLHMLRYVWLENLFVIEDMVIDFGRRPFIAAGFISFATMLPLALTSTRKWIGRLGGKRWQKLHRLVYLSAAAAVAHYFWLVKLDVRPPLAYGAVLALLLGFRVWTRMRSRPMPAASGVKIGT